MNNIKSVLIALVLGSLAVTSVGCYTEVRDRGHARIYEPAGASVEFVYRDGYYYRPHDFHHRYYRHSDGRYYHYRDWH